MASAWHDLVSAPELWRGAAVSLVVADAVVLGTAPARRRPPRHRRPAPWAAPLLSVVAAFAVYVTVPDTERALAVLGATAGAAFVALLHQWRWPLAALLVTAGLLWVAAEDGPPRASAVVGAVAIALLHVLLQHRLTVTVTTPVTYGALVALAGGAMGVAARVAGRGGGLAWPLVEAVLVVVGTQAIAREITRRSLPR